MAELDSVWRLLPAGHWEVDSLRNWDSVRLTLEHRDGWTATIILAGPARLTYRDSSTQRRRPRTMVNAQLFDLLRRLSVSPAP
jgi:hypothetical protein